MPKHVVALYTEVILENQSALTNETEAFKARSRYCTKNNPDEQH